jgi:hypothetical protein
MARRPAPETPALIDVRVLVVAALLVTPAAWQASQGLLSVDQVLTRYLLVALGCTAVLAFVRTVWPVLSGELAEQAAAEEAAARQEEAAARQEEDARSREAAQEPPGAEVSRPPE